MRLDRVLLVLLATLVADAAWAQTVWQRRNPEKVYLFRDTSARRVGDLLTILIRETTDVENKDARSMGKNTDTSFNFESASAGTNSAASGSLDISGQSDRKFSGNSQYSAEQEFTDRITVSIIDVLPNGNYVIGGRRKRLVAGEIRTLYVSGIVRGIDIGGNNTIQSPYIADFNICYEGDGPETSFTKQGWASRILNKIWPF